MTRASSNVTQGVVAVASVVLIGANVQVKYGVTIGLLPVVLLLPVWPSVLGRYRFARPLMAAAGIAVGWGSLLAWITMTDHQFSKQQAIAAALMVVTAVCAIGVLLWACEVLRIDTVAILFAVGLAASHLADHTGWVSNPWKYGFALPVSVAAVALAGRARSSWPSVLVLCAAGLISLFSDYRSFAGFCLITVLVVIWQRASRSPRARLHKLAPLFMLAALGLAAYFILVSLLVGGYFGTQLQQRSVSQIDASGGILIGGRPEWAATVQLMGEHPQGFGFGVLPNAVDVGYGDAGLRSVNVDPANGYEAYMFGGAFRLHSIIADLWAAAGWGGLLLAAVFLVILLRRLSIALAERTAPPLLILTTVIAIWALGFSPIFTDFKDLTLATFLAVATQRLRTSPEQPHARRRPEAPASIG